MGQGQLKMDIKGKHFVVLGDLILDHYRWVSASRLSPEAPVPIVIPISDEYRPGGAANVAQNLAALGAGDDVMLFSVSGDNVSPHVARGDYMPCVVREPGRLTTVKERIVTPRQQMLRIDEQSHTNISEDTARTLRETVIRALSWADVLVLSDYDHGVMIPELVRPVLKEAVARGVRVVLDSKAMDNLRKYAGCEIALPNMQEALKFTRLGSIDDISEGEVANFMLHRMNLRAVGLTLGRRGILLAERNKPQMVLPAMGSDDEEVVDVTGAGDSVTAAVASALSLGMNYEDAIRLANVVAGIVITKRGVATASMEEVVAARETSCKETR